ncbi:ribose 5-phosphate isomerase [Methanocalculus chunghsingensis]|uniref:Ribose-5-phosphate isomerase A n=1 Tax=Methanocalculus chunghsingensis TaxID=156457 RepID=A0A8J7WBI9_9EURY|nr:ribose-5-phosphate isomerase RpiA [Methanocalculus chunghsingensis]MBR1369902.1 ribose 5-phosphate isomerase [Methanocalculus chunghsingensis]
MDTAKQEAGYRAAGFVRDGMVIGIGTGSTVLYAMERIVHRIREENLSILGVPTSHQAAFRAVEMGIPLTSLDSHPSLDLAIDGADQVDPAKLMIKGRGAAHLREKCVADAARQFIVVVDDSKCVAELNGKIPIEVLPFACMPVIRKLSEYGGRAEIRTGSGKDGPVISDNGNIIMDCLFERIEDPKSLERELAMIPGIVASGLFTQYADKTTVIVGKK